MSYIEMLLSFVFSLFLLCLFVYLTLRLMLGIIAYIRNYKDEIQNRYNEIKAKNEYVQKKTKSFSEH